MTPRRGEPDLGSGSGHEKVGGGRRPVAHRVVRHEALLVSVGGERPHDQVVVAAWESWRQPDPGFAGEGGSSLDKVESVQYCRMGRAR